jgi:MFS transporter, SET family, sugar efflux transporter
MHWLGNTCPLPVLMHNLLHAPTAATSQLFAAFRDDLNQDPQGRSESVIPTIRMAFKAGWIVGPVLGTWLADTAGLRVTLWMTALCSLVQIIPVGNLKFRKVRPSETSSPETNINTAAFPKTQS